MNASAMHTLTFAGRRIGALLALLLVLQASPLAAQVPGAPPAQKRRIEPVQDLADAPPPKFASQASRAAFDRARQSLGRVRALNQQGNARRPDADGGEAAPNRPPPRPKTPKAR